MNKTSINNSNNKFLPFINSARINNKLNDTNKNLDIAEHIYTSNKPFLDNKILFNDLSNFRKVQVIKKINIIRNQKEKNGKYSSPFWKNGRNFINENFETSKINKNIINSSLYINNTQDKNKTFYYNQNNLSNLSLEKNNNKSPNHSLILDLNMSDSSKNLNSSNLYKSLIKKISSQSCNRIIKKDFKNSLFKFSSFFQKSKDEKITFKQIYKHYLKKEKNISRNTNQQLNGNYDYSSIMCPKLKILYGESNDLINKINEIKMNDCIAKKKDFNIRKYQNILMTLFKKTISKKNMDKLKHSFDLFNERNYGIRIPRGRYIELANKLKNHLSVNAFENLKRMDRNYNKYFSEENKDKNKKNKNRKNSNQKDKNEKDILDLNFDDKSENKLLIRKLKFKK